MIDNSEDGSVSGAAAFPLKRDAVRYYDAAKYKTPTGITISCKGWIQEAALRMLLNNLNPEVAERPDDLIVYGGRGTKWLTKI